MGSFNLSCNLTQLSIGSGKQIAFIPLIRAKVSSRHGTGSCVISNAGPCVEWIPFTLPIYGEYNDYGCIENIVKDTNTEQIEKHFGCDIETFTEFVCRPFEFEPDAGRGKNLPDGSKIAKLAKLVVAGKVDVSASMMHRHSFERFTETPVGEYRGLQTVYHESRVTDSMLTKLGFTVINDQVTQGFTATHEEIPGITVSSKNGWNVELLGASEKPIGIYNFFYLAQALVDHDQPVPFSLLSLKHSELSTVEVEYDEELELVNATTTSIFRDHSRFFAFSSESYMNPVHDLDFRYIYDSLFENTDIRAEFIRYKHLVYSMMDNNLRFQPCGTGPQCGNRDAEQKRIKVIQEQFEILGQKGPYDDDDDWEDPSLEGQL